MAAKCYLGLAGILIHVSTVQALEALDETAMSNVTGQAQGIRLTSEFETNIDAITYYDDDGYFHNDLNADGISAFGGSLRLSPVTISTPTNRPIVIDITVETNADGDTGLVFVNRDLAIDLAVGKMEINDVSIGAFGQNNFRIGLQNGGSATDEYRVELYGAGYDDANGVTANISLPNSMAFDTYYEDPDGNGTNPGGRMTSTVSFQSASGKTGLELKNLTLDVVDEGLRIGIPETNGGDINIYNAKLGDDVLNSVAYRNIDFRPGGYVLVKNARDASDSGIELDAVLKDRSSLDYVYIAGEVDVASGVVSDANIYEGSASFTLLEDFTVKNARVNVDKERGIVLDFDQGQTDSGASIHLLANDIKFRRSDRDLATAPTLGTFDARINLSASSYLQVEGH